jgi:hypothetical protein
VALSVSVSGPRPLAGTPPCGDRTFLYRFRQRLSIRQLLVLLSHYPTRLCIRKHVASLTKPLKLFEMDGFPGYSSPSCAYGTPVAGS